MLLEGLQECCGGCFSILVPKSLAGDMSLLLISISFPPHSSSSPWGDIVPVQGNVPELPPSLHPTTWPLLTAPHDLVRLVTMGFAVGTPTPNIFPTPPGSSPSSQCCVQGVPHPKIFRINSKPMICPNPPWLPLFPGVLPSKASFSMHSILVNHFLRGAWYPKGGAGEIAFHTIPVIRKAGGNVFGKAPVQRILLDPQGRACGEPWPGTGHGAAPQSGVSFTSTSFFPL